MKKKFNFAKKLAKQNKNKNLMLYTTIGAFISLLNIVLVWILIDLFKIPTLIATSVVVGSLFVFKFYLYKKTGFTS